MSEFEDRLNSILNDPDQLGKIADMAKSLMGGGEEPAPAQSPPPTQSPPVFDGLDPAMLKNMTRVLSGLEGQDDDKMALLDALKPFLAEKRRNKMERAMNLAKMARMAELAFGAFGGEFHV